MTFRISILMGFVAASLAAGQSPATRTFDVSQPCRTCALRLEKGPSLVDPTGGMGRFHNIAVIDRDSRGRYYVAVYGSHTNVMVFGADGKLLARIGRDGAGPREFRQLLSLLVGPGDTVHAFDVALRRRSEISPTTLEIVRQAPIANVVHGNVMIANGNFVGSSYNLEVTGHPFEEVDRKGNRVRYFGGDGKPSPSYAGPWLSRRVVSDRQGGFYALAYRNYLVEHWDATGNLTGRWERNATWFPRSEPVRVRPPWPQHSSPTIFGAWVSADGLLFVGSHVRQSGWEKAVVQGTCEGGVACPTVDEYDRYYDSIIEVFDMKTSKWLTAMRSDIAFTAATLNGELYSRVEDADVRFDVYRVVFERK